MGLGSALTRPHTTKISSKSESLDAALYFLGAVMELLSIRECHLSQSRDNGLFLEYCPSEVQKYF